MKRNENIHQRWMLTVLSMLIATTSNLACSAETFSANVVRVTDGDTLVVDYQGKTEIIRLNGIDCPESKQTFGNDATNFTRAACLNKTVQVQAFSQDSYGRTIADIKLPDGSLLNEKLVNAGFAWWYQSYAPENAKLQQLEKKARERHLGLWAQVQPIPPWEFRHPAQLTKPLEGRLSQISATAELTLAQTRVESADESHPAKENGRRPALQGGVVGVAPLQGGVEKVDSHLQESHPAYDRYATTRPMLQGKGVGDATIMRIVQTKFSPLAPESAPVPSRPLPPETNNVPLRATVNDGVPPIRHAEEAQPPARDNSSLQPLAHHSGEPPQRSQGVADQPPIRTAYDTGGPPTRTANGDAPPPPRIIPIDPPPPQRAQPRQNNYVPLPVVNIPPFEHYKRQKEKTNNNPNESADPKKSSKNTHVNWSTPETQQPSSAEEALLWDAWYKRVNEMVCAALTRTMPANGNPAGRNRIEVTVRANHEIQSVIIQPSNRNFDKAILEAYQSLNHHPALAFPKGTQRTVVNYETAHIQDISAPTSSFDSSTIHNDVEIIK